MYGTVSSMYECEELLIYSQQYRFNKPKFYIYCLWWDWIVSKLMQFIYDYTELIQPNEENQRQVSFETTTTSATDKKNELQKWVALVYLVDEISETSENILKCFWKEHTNTSTKNPQQRRHALPNQLIIKINYYYFISWISNEES